MKYRCKLLGFLGVVLTSLVAPSQAQSPSEIDAIVAEELLDHVLAHCRAGQAEQAQRLARDIREQFATTPPLKPCSAPSWKGPAKPPCPPAPGCGSCT